MVIIKIPFKVIGAGVFQITETTLNDGDVGIIILQHQSIPRPITIDLTPLTGATAAAFVSFADKMVIEGHIAENDVTENYWKESVNLASVTAANAQKNTSYDVFGSFVNAFKITSTGGQTIVRGGA